MSHKKVIDWTTGPWHIVQCDDNSVVKDPDTNVSIKFISIDDLKLAIEKLGLTYWPAGGPKPEKGGAYEQISYTTT